jgi:hypothetical protein
VKRHFLLIQKKRDYIYAAIFAAGAVTMFLPSEASPAGLRSVEQLWNLGHAALFFLAGHLIYTFMPGFSEKQLREQAAVLLAVVLAAGGFSEILQSLIPGRNASFFDMLINLTGMGACLAVKNPGKSFIHFLLYAAVACLIAICMWPFLRSVSDELIAKRQFPVLADFQTPFEADRFQSDTAEYKITDKTASTGTKSLELRLGIHEYSGIFMQYMPRNWQGYSWFEFQAYNPQTVPVVLTVRIHDKKHETSPAQLYNDRFNKSFSLAPQSWTTIAISLKEVRHAPATRRMDMEHIQSIGFFVANPAQELSIFLDNIILCNTLPDYKSSTINSCGKPS